MEVGANGPRGPVAPRTVVRGNGNVLARVPTLNHRTVVKVVQEKRNKQRNASTGNVQVMGHSNSTFVRKEREFPGNG